MKSFALAITVMLLLAVASLSMAFNVSVSVPGQEHAAEEQVYMTVDMQPMTENDVQAAEAKAPETAKKDPLVAEKK